MDGPANHGLTSPVSQVNKGEEMPPATERPCSGSQAEQEPVAESVHEVPASEATNDETIRNATRRRTVAVPSTAITRLYLPTFIWWAAVMKLPFPATSFRRAIFRALSSEAIPLRPTKAKAKGPTPKFFVDSKRIRAVGGNGGDGCISLLQVWSNENAGPDGGDGGNGGHVVIQASSNVRDLNQLDTVIKADEGERGYNKDCHGKSASHKIITVPIGTVVKSPSGEVLGDLDNEGTMFVLARGGAGGHGNHYFTSDVEQCPLVAEYGGKGEDIAYQIEVKSMAHFGLVGLPNAGKSTLLQAISRARPKVAPYPFTTLKPHLGMVQFSDFEQIAVADLPGLIEGSHKNRGLGISFLKHVERCSCLLLVVDLSGDPQSDLSILRREIELFNPELASRQQLVVGNKLDVTGAEDALNALANSEGESNIIGQRWQFDTSQIVNGAFVVHTRHFRLIWKKNCSQPPELHREFSPKNCRPRIPRNSSNSLIAKLGKGFETNMVKEEAVSNVFVISGKHSISENGNDGGSHEPTEQEKHPTTYFETLTHMVKACFGTGILAIPSAFSRAGWVVGIIGTVIIGSICTYAFHVLLNAETTLKRKRPDIKKFTYYSIAQASVEEGPKKLRWLAHHVPAFCKFFFVIAQVGSCCIYVVFISKNLKEIIDYYQDPKDRIDSIWYLLSTLIPLILINWVRNLKYLAPFSVIGSTATFISFGIIFYYILRDVPGMSKVQPVGDAKGFIAFFSTVLFSLEAVAVVMPLKNQMLHPEQFGKPFGVLNAAMIPNLILFTSLGFLGYLRYGSDIQESIPLSLPSDEITARVSRLLLILAIFISHPLQLYMAFDVVWNEYLEPRTKNHRLLVEYIVRTTLVILTVVFAITIPHLNLFIALIGSFCFSTLGLTIPALISIFAHWYDRSGWQFFLWAIRNYIIIFIGLSALVVGASTAIRDIAHQLMS
ncbi:hypothetical protein GE061_006142 [Apolygus lucorum]|uniref:Amino acid transporter transmembrane domain-containing protein n=1 Tax=Apolygus lucorum TaxID=248454 RepID=A0A8S9WUF3_APOLU|nr:hypothetical protein GE061_006142 [Apolygus lucorum]